MAQLSLTSGRGRRRRIHLDMTPMVDLAFLLLTFFVLTMTLNEQHALQMQMPEQDQQTEPTEVNRERVLTLLLTDADKIYYSMGNDPMAVTGFAFDGIRNVISSARTRRRDLVILIKPTTTSRYQNLVDIIDEMEICHIERYYLVKETEEDRQMIANASR